MARLVRVVASGHPHHITRKGQRENRYCVPRINVRFVDNTGAAAIDPSPVDRWAAAAAAVADAIHSNDWQRAHAELIAAQSSGGRPQDGKQCCCKGEDANKCHIYVTHLAVVGIATTSRVNIPRSDLGLPAFPDNPTHVRIISGYFAGVVTAVQLKHEENKDTGGCNLVSDCEDLRWQHAEFTSGFTALYTMKDIGAWGLKSNRNLNTSHGGNWYIDSPLGVSTVFRRAFQQHVTVEDKKGQKIPGLEAYYGFKYYFPPSEGAEWDLWPNVVGRTVQDPKDGRDLSAGLSPEEKRAFSEAREENIKSWGK